MSERELSVTENFCVVIAEIRSIKDSYDTSDPLRFAKRKAAMTATKVLHDATISAAEIVACCKMFEQDAGDTEKYTSPA